MRTVALLKKSPKCKVYHKTNPIPLMFKFLSTLDPIVSFKHPDTVESNNLL